MQTDESGEGPRKDTGNRDALLGGIALGVLLAGMAWSPFDPGPEPVGFEHRRKLK